MSDDNKPQDEAPKKLRGFANPKNRKNINTNGRKPGTRNAVPTAKQIEDDFLKASPRALKKLLDILDKGTENNQLKAAFKLADTSVQIIKDRNTLAIRKKNAKTGESESYTAETQKATGTGNVVKFISTTYNEDKESEDDED